MAAVKVVCCLVVLSTIFHFSSALICDSGGFTNSYCPKGCCVDPDIPWDMPKCCEKTNTKLLLGQIIALGVSSGIGIIVALVFAACWIHEHNKYKTRVQSGFILVPTTIQGNMVTPFYPQTTPTAPGGAVHYQQTTPTYLEPHPGTSDPRRLPPISHPMPPAEKS